MSEIQGEEEVGRWSLLKLPNEILARIVHLCSEQDKRCNERLIRVKRYDDVSELCTKYDGSMRRSLQELSRTCKSVRAICVPYLFSKVTTQKAASATFRRRIVPHHTAHIREVELRLIGPRSRSREKFVDYLVIASELPNLRQVVLDRLFLNVVAPVDPVYREFTQWLSSESEAAIALRLVLSRAEHLSLEGFSDRKILSLLLEHVQALESLKIEDFGDEDTALPDEQAALAAQILGIPSLRKLSIDSSSRRDLFTSPNLPVCPLESLDLPHATLDREDHAFIAHFAPTLTSLCISTFDEMYSVTLTSPFEAPFPLLRRLQLDMTTQTFLNTPASLFPSLRHLSLRVDCQKLDVVVEEIATRIPQLAALESIEFALSEHSEPQAGYDQNRLLEEAFKPLRSVVNLARYNPFLPIDHTERYSLDDEIDQIKAHEFIRRRRRRVQEVLKFGLELEETSAVTGDARRMEQLIEALRTLEMLKDFQED